MKITINSILVLVSIITLSSCSEYLIKDNAILSKSKKFGIILRISNGSKISRDELIQNAQFWMGIYQKNENISIIADTSDSISYFKYPQERFYQLSNENDYLKYKSIGVLNLYLQNNRNELFNISSTYKLDGFIIYEIYSIISTEMQFFEFDSVLAIIDSNLNIAYLDHESDHFASESSLLNELKNQTMDKIYERLITSLRELDILGDRTENKTGNVIIHDKNMHVEEQEEKTNALEKETLKNEDEDYGNLPPEE